MSDSNRVRRRVFSGLDGNLGPARPLSSADAEWFVEQAVGRALGSGTKARPRLLSVRALSLVAIVVATSAAAATAVHQRIERTEAASAPAISTPPRANKPLRAHVQTARVSEPIEEAVPSAELAPIAPDAPSPPAASPIREIAPPVTSGSNAVLSAQEEAIVDELSEANDLRRKADWQAAEAAYRGVAAHYPRAREATVAQLAAASLRLEHLGDAAGALRLYQSVPRGSALGVEALFGVSRAYRALGNRDSEVAALRSVIDEYPTSLQADGARARLKQLSTDSEQP